MKTRKNAGIKSKRELAERLLAGEVFWFGEDRVRFNESLTNPFRAGSTYMYSGWNHYADFETEVETHWYENIPEGGVLCWVSNNGSKGIVLPVKGRKESGWFVTSHGSWPCATPLTNDEIKGFLRDE